jgi:hypothetical protein
LYQKPKTHPKQTFLPEGIIVGFCIFVWGFKSHKQNCGKTTFGARPLPGGQFFFILKTKMKNEKSL